MLKETWDVVRAQRREANGTQDTEYNKGPVLSPQPCAPTGGGETCREGNVENR